MRAPLEDNGRRAFLTGATGFVGANLTRELLDRGWRVTCTRRQTSSLFRLNGLNISLKEADLSDQASLENAIPDNVDAVFHLAADLRLSDRATDEQVDTNVVGTRHLLEAARVKGAQKVVLVSSMAAFGLHDCRIDETVISNAMSVPIGYFRSKRLAEIEAERANEKGLNVTIVNPANVIGPFDVMNLPATFIRLVANERLALAAAGKASFCHVRSASAAMVNAVDRGRTGQRYLLGGADSSFAELGALVAEITGGKAPTIALPKYHSLEEAAQVRQIADRYKLDFLTPELAFAVSCDMLVDDKKAQKELDYAPASLRQMICDELNWMRDRGVLGLDTASI